MRSECWRCEKPFKFKQKVKYIKGDINTLFCDEKCLREHHNDIQIRDYTIDIEDLKDAEEEE